MERKGTINSKTSNNPQNPNIENHLTSRSEYKEKWRNFLHEVYTEEENPAPFSLDMEWIDQVNLEEKFTTATRIEISDQDLKDVFRSLSGRTNKSPGPNCID